MRVTWVYAWNTAWDIINTSCCHAYVMLGYWYFSGYLVGELNVAGVIIKDGFVNFVNSLSFCLIYIETFLEENECVRFGDISTNKRNNASTSLGIIYSTCKKDTKSLLELKYNWKGRDETMLQESHLQIRVVTAN